MAHKWWQRGVVYQIYPRSLQDSNGDGVGDIGGILQRLDYFASLAVDALWLSPIYPSPMADFGYDVSDYTDIHPIFGTLEEFDALMAALRHRNLELILDFVPNHTSDRHPWFETARRSRDNDKRDWYLWRDPAPGGGPPNNWLSQFGGSAWQYDAATAQYYYHAFLKEQPDLNWRNPAVRAAMYEVMRFWLRRGVGGFRVDVLWHLIKDDQWRDNPPNPAFRPGEPPHHSQIPLYNTDRPEVQGIVTQMRQVLDEFDERVLIGEIYLPVERLVAYYGTDLDGAQLPFNFQLVTSPWNAGGIAGFIDRYEQALPAGSWPNWVLGNHDNPRIASRVGLPQARVAAMLLLTLRGTPTMYYGDELGMVNGVIPSDRVRDPFEKNVPGMGMGRDPCRTPMQWNESPHAGFSTAEPWLPISDDYSEVNVAAETADAESVLTLYRQLLELRRAHAALSVGDYEAVAMTGDLVAYIRRAPGPGTAAQNSDGKQVVGEAFLVALNLGGEPYELSLTSLGLRGRVILSTHLDRADDADTQSVALRADEGVIVQLAPAAA
jgi:alpha-glucosidase